LPLKVAFKVAQAYFTGTLELTPGHFSQKLLCGSQQFFVLLSIQFFKLLQSFTFVFVRTAQAQIELILILY